MLNTSRRHTELMDRTAVFKVKVISSKVIRSQRSCDLFRVRCVTVEPIEGFRRNLAHMLTILSLRAELNFQTVYRKFNAKGLNVI